MRRPAAMALDHVVDAGQGLDGAEEPPPVGAEGDEVAGGEAAVGDHEVAADADHADVAEEADGAAEGEKEVAGVDGFDLLDVVGLGGVLEAFGFLFFAAEDFDDSQAGEIFLQAGGDVAETLAGGGVDGADAVVEIAEQDVHEQQGGEGGGGHAPVHGHDDEDGGGPEQAFADDDVDAVDDEGLEFIDVVHGAAHEIADALALEVAEALGLELVVDLVAQVADEFLGDAVEQPGDEGFQGFADEVDREEPGDGGGQQAQAGVDVALEGDELPEPGGGVVVEGDVVGDESPDEGGKEFAGGGDGQEQQSQADHGPVGAQHEDEPPEDAGGSGFGVGGMRMGHAEPILAQEGASGLGRIDNGRGDEVCRSGRRGSKLPMNADGVFLPLPARGVGSAR